jgi:hypothetical protein
MSAPPEKRLGAASRLWSLHIVPKKKAKEGAAGAVSAQRFHS